MSEEENTTYIASCSFGKDSIATILLAHIHNEPLDFVVFSEVMFDEETSGENPDHIDFIYKTAIPKIEALGYKVIVVRGNTTYKKEFLHKKTKSKDKSQNGKIQGFLLSGKCCLNSRGKVEPIKKFLKQYPNRIQYIGIAIDEPERLARLHKSSDKVSLLEKYNYTENDAMELCKEYGLVSPIYKTGSRGGCWFCPNTKTCSIVNLIKNNKNVWNKLEKLYEDNKHRLVNKNWVYDKTFEMLEFEINNKLNQLEFDFKE